MLGLPVFEVEAYELASSEMVMGLTYSILIRSRIFRRNAAALKTINTRDSNFDDEDDEKYLATKNNENEILRDLFWTLFSKLECVTQGHSTVLIAGERLLRVRSAIFLLIRYETSQSKLTDVASNCLLVLNSAWRVIM